MSKKIRTKAETVTQGSASSGLDTPQQRLLQQAKRPYLAMRRWVQSRQADSPHRSFRRTYRRDYERQFNLPGYVRFTMDVYSMLWRHKGTFGLLIVAYALISGLMVGTASQSTYSQLSELIRSDGSKIASGDIGQLGEAGVLLLSGLSGGLNPAVSEAQQILAGFLVIMVWLTTVWLLRAYLAGKNPRVRDGIYNAGAPIIPTFLVAALLIVQLIPAAIVAIGVSAAIPTGLLSGGVEAMLFWTVAFLLLLLSLYFVSGTLIALVIVTLPGMYPMQAIKSAGDLVVGRRFRILKRLLWLIIPALLMFVVVMVPVILFDAWLKGVISGIDWLPLVPICLLLMSALTTVWSASYVYLLYRRLVDDESE